MNAVKQIQDWAIEEIGITLHGDTMPEILTEVKDHIEGLMDQVNALENPPWHHCGHSPENCKC